jgi:hypothetical protein
MSVRKADDPELFESVQEKNLLRQYDLLLNCIEIGLAKGIEACEKYGFTLEQLRELAANAVEASFLPPTPKLALLARIEQYR